MGEVNECGQWVTAYSPVLHREWQANMDMVSSEYGQAMYVYMYVSERLKYDTLQNVPPDASQCKRLY